MSSINSFNFVDEFEINTLSISLHGHHWARIANYRGFPLVLGGKSPQSEDGHNKLEWLNTIENPPRWIDFNELDYPYSKS